MPQPNFNINDLVDPNAPKRSPLAQRAVETQKQIDTMRNQGATGPGIISQPAPLPKQMFENQEYKNTRRAQERTERQAIKGSIRRGESP